ncbi:hypothetical protein FAI40_06505 [Acetobacteraceae bacterium]|nr:hypothetical protein FAI40_06505 [Acetobacteraceae bacterium]
MGDTRPKVKVLICCGGHFESQANRQVREAMQSGFEDVLGEEQVIAVDISGAAFAISSWKPDLVFATGSYLPESTYFGEVSRTARACGAVTVFWATEDPYEQDAHYQIADDFDVIFSCDRWGHHFYQRDRVFHLPLAASPTLHYGEIDSSVEKTVDVFFCGVAFSCRKEVVRSLMPELQKVKVRFVGPGWGEFGPGFSDARIEKTQLIELYRRARIVLNLGRSLHFENKRFMIAPSTPGPRTFETALAGAFQLFHEETYEMRRYYDADEIPVFNNRHDFAKLLKTYLGNPEKRQEMARKAQKRTLENHLYRHRIETIMQVLRDENLLKS